MAQADGNLRCQANVARNWDQTPVLALQAHLQMVMICARHYQQDSMVAATALIQSYRFALMAILVTMQGCNQEHSQIVDKLRHLTPILVCMAGTVIEARSCNSEIERSDSAMEMLVATRCASRAVMELESEQENCPFE